MLRFWLVIISTATPFPCMGAETVQFSSEECYREYFPLALGLPSGAIPTEVEFYCAAPWDMAVFEGVRSALKDAHFNEVEAIVSTVSPTKAIILRQTLSMAYEAADNGPPGMGATYRIYKFLPWLHALKIKSSDAEVVSKFFGEKDVAALRSAAEHIDWNQRVLLKGHKPGTETTLTSSTRLLDLTAFILSFRKQ